MAIPTDERQYGTKSETDASSKHGQQGTKSQTNAPLKYSKEVQHSKNNKPGPSGQSIYQVPGPSEGIINYQLPSPFETTVDYQPSDLSTKYHESQEHLLDHYPPGYHPADPKLSKPRKQLLKHHPLEHHTFRSHSPSHNHPRHHHPHPHPPPLHVPSHHPFQILRPPPPHISRPPPPNHYSTPSCPIRSFFSLGSPRHHNSALPHSSGSDSPAPPHLDPNHYLSSPHPPNPNHSKLKHHYPPHYQTTVPHQHNPHSTIPFHFYESTRKPPHFQGLLHDPSTSPFPIPQSPSTLSLPFTNKALPSTSLQSIPSKLSPFSHTIPLFWKSSLPTSPPTSLSSGLPT